jgi:hypothetical protein
MFGRDWNDGTSIGFLFALVLGVWAVINILQNDRTGPLGKAVWSVLVMFVPFLGFLAWLFIGPKATKKRIG